jgi:hypothetical protein
VQLACDRAEDAEPPEKGWWEEGVASDADIECSFFAACISTRVIVSGFLALKREGRWLTISRLVETVLWIAMAREDDDFVAAVLEANGGVYYEAFGTSDA